MKSIKKRGQRGAVLPGMASGAVIGGVTVGSTRRPPGSSRTGSGRLGSALIASKKKAAPLAKPKAPIAKALSRWENEGGRSQTPAAATKPAPKPPMKMANRKTEPNAILVPVPPDRADQRKVKARVKGPQIKRTGLENRLLGQASASSNRTTLRRGSKNR